MSSTATADPAECAMAMVRRALAPMLGSEPAPVVAATEAQVQSALQLLRRSGCDAQLVRQVEKISATLFVMVQARRNGRTNLYASRRLQLRRLAGTGEAAPRLH